MRRKIVTFMTVAALVGGTFATAAPALAEGDESNQKPASEYVVLVDSSKEAERLVERYDAEQLNEDEKLFSVELTNSQAKSVEGRFCKERYTAATTVSRIILDRVIANKGLQPSTLFPIGADATNEIIGDVKLNGIKILSESTDLYPGTRVSEAQWNHQSTDGIV